MALTGNQQNPIATNPQTVAINSVETASGIVEALKYRMPSKLQGVVREEEWVGMETQQQYALIMSVDERPENYLIQTQAFTQAPILNQANPDRLPENIPAPVPVESYAPIATPVIRNESTAEVKVTAFKPVIEESRKEFTAAKNEISSIEQDFITGKSAEKPVQLNSSIEQGIEAPNVKPGSEPVLTQEDKARIAEERGGSIWLPKLFGYKPTATTVAKVSTTKTDDPADYQISNAESWLRLLLGKLFKRAMANNDV
jgi:hypothetical protein